MEDISGNLGETAPLELLRRIASGRGTGLLEMVNGEETERFYFVTGDLYLEPRHDLARVLAEGSKSGAPSADWYVEIAVALNGWQEGEFSFSADPSQISTELVGPVPTIPIVMAGAVHGLDEFKLLRMLGGEEQKLIAAPASVAPPAGSVRLDPEEAFLLSRLEHPVSVKEMLAQSELEPLEALQRLCRLLSVDLICREERLPEATQSSLLNPKLLSRLSKSILESLEREPLELETEDHRSRLVDLLSRLGGMTYYEILMTSPSATADEIHAGYTDIARLIHPSHADRLGLAGKEGGLEMAFEMATQAYLTLSDEERAQRYFAKVGGPGGGGSGTTSGVARDDEVERVAERNYKMAKSMALREDFHFAIELLNQTVRMKPKAEYYVLLGDCQARNPQWYEKAIASYGRALHLEPDDIETRVALGRVYEATGQRARAQSEYQAVLAKMPGHSEALEGLKRLQSKPQQTESDEDRPWWQKIIKR